MRKEHNQILAKCSALILAAGLSQRFGTPKLSLRTVDGITFVEKLITSYNKFGIGRVVLVINPQGLNFIKKISFENLRVVVNNHPEWGRYYSIKLGLTQCLNQSRTFIHNIDNPTVNQDILVKLADKITHCSYVCPEYKGKGGHPVVIDSTICTSIINETNNNYNLRNYLEKFKKSTIEVDDCGVLLNINTRQDYKDYLKSFW